MQWRVNSHFLQIFANWYFFFVCVNPNLILSSEDRNSPILYVSRSAILWKAKEWFLAPSAMATHSSILAWRIPWTKEPGGLQSMELQRVGHAWSDLALQHLFSPSEKYKFFDMDSWHFLNVMWSINKYNCKTSTLCWSVTWVVCKAVCFLNTPAP